MWRQGNKTVCEWQAEGVRCERRQVLQPHHLCHRSGQGEADVRMALLGNFHTDQLLL